MQIGFCDFQSQKSVRLRVQFEQIRVATQEGSQKRPICQCFLRRQDRQMDQILNTTQSQRLNIFFPARWLSHLALRHEDCHVVLNTKLRLNKETSDNHIPRFLHHSRSSDCRILSYLVNSRLAEFLRAQPEGIARSAEAFSHVLPPLRTSPLFLSGSTYAAVTEARVAGSR